MRFIRMKRAITLLLLGMTTACASMPPKAAGSSRGEWQRVCRPGHGVRFAIPAGHAVPADYRAPRGGSCMR